MVSPRNRPILKRVWLVPFSVDAPVTIHAQSHQIGIDIITSIVIYVVDIQRLVHWISTADSALVPVPLKYSPADIRPVSNRLGGRLFPAFAP